MLPDDSALISVDDHIIEHPRVWSDRLPAALVEAGPHIVEQNDGTQQWCFEGVVDGPTGLSAVAGTDLRDRGLEPNRFDQMRPGYFDPVARLADLDEDGIWAQLNFPNYAGFAGSRFFRARDRDLALLCVKAYNDFVLDEWCAAAPSRYIPMMITPFWDADLVATEVERCLTKGVKAISFPDNPAPLGLPSFHTDHWNGFLGIANEAGLPLCMHFGTSGTAPPVASDAPMAVMTVLMGSTLFASMTDLLMSPALHRFKDLKVCYSEGQIGWMPFAIQRIDQVWEHYRLYNLERNVNPDVRPSDLFRRHVYGCFIDDQVGIDMRHAIGVDNILWECDYPHADSIWPNSRKVAGQALQDVPDEEARKIAELNARRVFNFAGEAPL